MSICQYVRMQLFSLVIKMKVVQNVKTISENIILVCSNVSMSVCQYVRLLIFQNATFQLRYRNERCSKCHQEKVVKKFEREREGERKSERERKREIGRERERVGESGRFVVLKSLTFFHTLSHLSPDNIWNNFHFDT